MLTNLTRRTAAVLALPALLLSACGSNPSTVERPADDTSASEAATDPDGDMTDDEMDAMTEDAVGDVVIASPVTASVATAPDGSTFSISDFAGQVVFVETFATWCSKCRRQLTDTQQAAVRAGDGAVFLALSIETSLDPADLEAYAQENGFTDLRFGVLEPEALAAFDDEFGSKVLNAPSTPKFVVAADGTLSALTTGAESVEEILAQLDA